MKYKFVLDEKGTHYILDIRCMDEEIRFTIDIAELSPEMKDEIDWDIVDKTVDYICAKCKYLKDESDRMAFLLMKNTKFYQEEDIHKVKGFDVIEIEMAGPFFKSQVSINQHFNFVLSFESDCWFEVYGLILVKFSNDTPIGVERIQW